MSDVLLISAPVRGAATDQHASMGPPLGLAYIAAVLMENGYRPSIVDLNLSGLNPDRVRRIVEVEDPAILGISAHTETYLSGLEIARIAKEMKPDLPIVMGGPHSTVMYEEVIGEECVDFVARGEGEFTMLALTDLVMKGGSPADIEGIAYKEGGSVHATPDRPFIDDPDILPYPARGLLPLDFYDVAGNILTSRGGCPFNCDFCAVNNIWQRRRRHRDPEKVVEEVKWTARQFQLSGIVFADDTFTLNRNHVLRLCELLPEAAVLWKCATRADLVDEEILTAMASAGCTSIQYGVEAGSQDILDLIGKGITLEQVRSAVKMTLDAGIREILCSFMFPHPADTPETVRAQKDFMKELIDMGAHVSMSYTSPYPGTAYYEHAEELGIKILSDSWDDFNAKHLNITTKHLSEEELASLADEIIAAVGLEHA